jgi:hypothetical protein
MVPPEAWALVYVDDQRFIWLRRTPDTSALIDREEFRLIRPWFAPQPVTAANASAVLDEAERAVRNCHEHATFAYAYKAKALRLLGREAEAREAESHHPHP